MTLSGCDQLGSGKVIIVTIKAEAKTNSAIIVNQPVEFEYKKTGGQTFTRREIFVVNLYDPNLNYTTNYVEAGYNFHSGEIITVSRYHPLAVPILDKITYTYDSCLSLAKAQNPGSENSDTLYLTLTPTFLLYESG